MTETASQPALTDDRRRAIQRRTLQVLFASAVASRAAMTLGFAVAVLLIEDMLGSKTWAGLSTVSITVGTAISAKLLTSFMNRHGRRPGLAGGFGVAAVGGLVALFGAQQSSLVIFLGGLVLAGIGAGASNLSRYAAADLAESDAKAKAISFIVFASTVGAVGGPALVGFADDIGVDQGLEENVGPYALTAVFFVVASLIIFAGLRPDPLVVSGGLDSATTPTRAGFFESIAMIQAQPMARLALASLVISQAVMVGVMAMTPLHMRDHGHDVSVIGWVISAHTAGMFAFAPLAGWAADKFGKVYSIAVGGGILVIATALTALAGEAPKLLMFPGLYLLGLGWSFGMVAGSALLSESMPDQQRVSAQGAADLVASIVSGVAALGSGLVLTMTGFHILSAIGMLASGLLLVAAYARGRQGPPSGRLAGVVSGSG